MPRMIFRKAERERLAKAFAAVLAARHSRKGWGDYTHEFDTRVGKLWININVDERMLTVFGRFDEPDRAAADLPSGWGGQLQPLLRQVECSYLPTKQTRRTDEGHAFPA